MVQLCYNRGRMRLGASTCPFSNKIERGDEEKRCEEREACGDHSEGDEVAILEIVRPFAVDAVKFEKRSSTTIIAHNGADSVLGNVFALGVRVVVVTAMMIVSSQDHIGFYVIQQMLRRRDAQVVLFPDVSITVPHNVWLVDASSLFV